MPKRISEQGYTTLQTIVFLLTALAAYLTCWGVFQFAYVPSGSMFPTFNQGDVIICLKTTSPEVLEREDIITFRPTTDANASMELNPNVPYVKRLIGLPGDNIEVSDGVLYVNGTAQVRSYTAEEVTGDFAQITVPENSLFVMGDNRNYSIDSRFIGFIPFENFYGRVISHTCNPVIFLLRNYLSN